MALDRSIYEYYLAKFLKEQGAEGVRLDDQEEVRLLKEIKDQTSDKKGILQNVAGNFISDGVIFLIKRILK